MDLSPNELSRATGRPLAAIAFGFDVVGVGLVVPLFGVRPGPAALGVAAVLLLGAVGVWRPRFGVSLLLVRGPLAILLAIAGLVNGIAFVAAGGVAVGAWFGLVGASRVPASTTEASTRRDRLWSATLHLAVFAALVVVAALDSPAKGATLGLLWVGVMWGGVGIHEVGHAIGAAVTGNAVKHLDIGLGLPLLRTPRLTVRAVPLTGFTEWAPAASMTSRREAVIVAAGPAANLLCGLALSLTAWGTASDLLAIGAAAQYFAFLVNLVPFKAAGHGPAVGSDGMRLFRLLSRTG